MIRLRLGATLAAEVIASDFASTSELARQMHAALVLPEISRPSGIGDVLTVRASPESWDALADWASELARTDPGDDSATRLEAARWARLQARIAKALAHLAQHPGYRGVAVLGRDTTVLPARRCGDEGRWWPTARQAANCGRGPLVATELVPDTLRRQGQMFTRWVVADSPGS